MVTKKTHSSSKTKTPKKSIRTNATPTGKTVHATEPYHPAFGIILLIVCAIMVAVLLVGAIKTFVHVTYSDKDHFAEEYSLTDKDNVFKTRTFDETVITLKYGTGIVFLGFPGCQWCQAYVPMLNDLAKEYGISEINYYNIENDRKNNTEEYQYLVSILSDYLQNDETGNPHIYVPETAFVINGEIIGNDFETSKETYGKTPEEYWTEERVKNWKMNVGALMERIKSAEGCTSTCNE